VRERLDALYRRYGVFLTRQKSLVLPGSEGKAQIDATMARFRKNAPAEIGGYAVTSSHDLDAGAFDLPKSNVLVYFLDGDRRIIMRPSGTEPKLKCYYEVRQPVGDDDTVVAALERARTDVDALCDAHQRML
jgi:phosphomannomutase